MLGVDFQCPVEAGKRFLRLPEVVQSDPFVDQELRVNGIEAQRAVVAFQRLFVLEEVGKDQPFALPVLGTVRHDCQELGDEVQRLRVLLIVEIEGDNFLKSLDAGDVRGAILEHVLIFLQLFFEVFLLPLIIFRLIIEASKIKYAHITIPLGVQF